MKSIKKTFVFVFFILLINSCQEDKEIDTEKPVIDLTMHDAFPVTCDTLYFGETFTFKARFIDNLELASFNIDIHNNFDHHSHSYTIEECNLSPVKDPENPFVFIQDYSIPSGENQYTTNLSIEIPAQNNLGKYDEGDYHFHINLIDKKGWSAPLGLSVKILYQ